MNFKIYKKGQGTYTRIGTAMASLLIVGFGCWRLYALLQAVTIADRTVKIWVQSLVPVAVFGVLGLVVAWILNTKTVADFMINAEGEIKKVSWSSRQEIMVSTYVVIIGVLSMAFFLGLTDIVFQLLFRGIGLLPSQ